MEDKIQLQLPEGEKKEDILKNITCASFDLRLGNHFKMFPRDENLVLNPFTQNDDVKLKEIELKDGEDLILKPGDFILGAIKEQIGIPDDILARVEGRSSIARLGVLVHITGSIINPGFGWGSPSTITLEIKNVNNVSVVLKPNMKICQISFEKLDSFSEMPANKKASEKYSGQIKPEISRLHQEH